jgi:hypothetical protein
VDEHLLRGIAQSSKATTTGHFLVREVPEPGTCGLVLFGLLLMVTRRRLPDQLSSPLAG